MSRRDDGTGTGAKRLGSLKDAAAYHGVKDRTIHKWGSEGRLTLYRVAGRLIRVDMDEVEALARPMPIGPDAGDAVEFHRATAS